MSSEVSTINAVGAPGVSSLERRAEAEVLIQAITTLHGDGMLTDAEYESKRQRLAIHL